MACFNTSLRKILPHMESSIFKSVQAEYFSGKFTRKGTFATLVKRM